MYLWDRIYDILVGKEKRRDVQCKFIQKDNWVNEYKKNPQWNNYYVSMQIPTTT
jgi:hypothetical protein